MKPVTLVALSFSLAAAGTWANNKQVSTKQIVGGAFLALFVGIMASSQPKLAQQFSWVILAGTLGAYGQDVFEGIGKLVGSDKVPQNRAANRNAGSNGAGGTTTRQRPS